MGIEIQTELKPYYAHVYCRGVVNRNEIFDMWETAFQFAATEGREILLIDLRGLTGEPFTPMERYEFGKRVAELHRGCGRGIALAVVGNEPMIEPGRFGETVARNRGSFARAFIDIDEAVHWIYTK